MKRTHSLPLLLATIAGLFAATVGADPCGMVPPVWTGPGPAIERVGLQKTYVFYKDGIETFAVRPGFEGKVDNFGMLIPVPSVPSIKKIADDAFSHIAAAIDPPEVTVWVGDAWPMDGPTAAGAQRKSAARGDAGLEYAEDRVTVVKEEAVGMYQVVVLDAGSAKALKAWMEEHEYTYPQGMDGVCQEYVEAGWMFVAVKAKVGQKPGVDPRAGMEETNPDRPAGSVFDGHVQGMAFRFRTEKLVVPMRLSSYNEGDLHNVVYILTDGPTAIQDIPADLVKRQISGDELYLNLTQPLPLRIYGGGYDDIPDWQRSSLAAQRDPRPHNGLARELFAADLLAAGMGELSLVFEEREKELLNISERLGLRGEEIDRLHRQALERERDADLDSALMDLLDMTLTVVDGDFQREVLRRDNLHFIGYEIPAPKNTPEAYQATAFGPGGQPGGIRWVDDARRSAALDVARLLKGKSLPERRQAIAEAEEKGESVFNPPLARETVSEDGSLPWVAAAVAALVALGLGIALGAKLRKKAGTAALLLCGGSALLMGGGLEARKAPAPGVEIDEETRELLLDLHDPTKAPEAADALAARGEASAPGLIAVAFSEDEIAARGWAIVALSGIGGEEIDRTLSVLHDDSSKPELVRTWAAAARVMGTDDHDALLKLADLAASMPALGRPIAKKLVAETDGDKAEVLISLSQTVPSLAEPLRSTILALPAADLARAMTRSRDQQVRFMAASYLGGKFNAGDDGVAQAVIDAYAFDAEAGEIPWKGGALYVPGIEWTKEDGGRLVRNLLAWGLWCERKETADEYWQIHNNLNSVSLARVVGYRIDWNARDIRRWMYVCGQALGREAIEEILTEQGVQEEAQYKAVLKQLE